MKKLVVGILILASFGLAACGNSNNTSQADTKKSSTQTETTLTITDSNGDQIEVPNNPEKVVVFDNGSLDTMDALGVGDKVVGPIKIKDSAILYMDDPSTLALEPTYNSLQLKGPSGLRKGNLQVVRKD